MKRSAILALATASLLTGLSAHADGYKDAPPPNRGPEPLSPESTTYHPGKPDRTVKIIREIYYEPTCRTSCCSCGPVSYRSTYVTEPVEVRHYTRTYTRMAPPQDCRGYGGRDYDDQVTYRRYAPASDPAVRTYSYNEPVYEPGTVIWSNGRDAALPPAYSSRLTESRTAAWTGYDRSWKSRTNETR